MNPIERREALIRSHLAGIVRADRCLTQAMNGFTDRDAAEVAGREGAVRLAHRVEQFPAGLVGPRPAGLRDTSA